jgi:hypothetical protein
MTLLFQKKVTKLRSTATSAKAMQVAEKVPECSEVYTASCTEPNPAVILLVKDFI